MKKQKLWIAGILLAVLLVLICGAQAETPLGVQTGASYKKIKLSESSDAATVLDWLNSYMASELSGRITQAKILMESVDRIEANKEMLSSLNDDQIKRYMAVYNATPENGLLSAKDLPETSYRNLIETRNEIDFFATKLTEMLVQDQALRDQILGGGYTPLEIDQLKSELEIVDREAEKYRAGALRKLTGEAKLTASVRQAEANLSIFDASNPYQQTVLSIEGLGEYLIRREAEQISLRENQDEEQPHITVISKEHIGVEVKKDTGVNDEGLPIAEGVEGIEITLYAASGKPGIPDETRKQTKTTDKDGLVLFNVGDFSPVDGVCVEVYMTMYDPQKRYQRKNYGFCHMEGGTDPVRLYVEEDTGDPYLVSMLFEDLDMTVMDEGMYATEDDTQQYSINGEVEMNGRTDVQYHVQLLDLGAASGNSETPLALVDEVIKPNGSTTFSVKKQWLNMSLPEGEITLRGGHQLQLSMTVESLNGNAAANDVKIVPAFKNMNADVVHKWLEGSYQKSDETPSKSYLDSFVGNVGIALPSGIPLVGGSEISIGKLTDIEPMNKIKALKYIKVQVYLPNKIMIGINYGLVEPTREGGRLYADKGMEALDKREESNNAKATDFKAMWNQGVGDVTAVRGAGKWAKSFSYAITPFAHLIGSAQTVSDDDDIVTVTIDVKAGVIFDLCYDATWYPWPKIFINFNTLFRIQFGVDLGGAIDINYGGGVEEVRWSDDTGFFIGLHFEFTLTGGVGIRGVFSGGARGAFWVDLYDLLPIRDKEDPLTIGARVEVFVDTLFWKWSTILIQWKSNSTVESPTEAQPAQTGGAAKLGSGRNALDIPREGLKVIQTKHATLAFYVNRNNPDGRDTLEMCTLDYTDGEKYNYPAKTIFTPYIYNKYIYGFDVVYDEHFENMDYHESGDPEGIYYVVSAGDWEGGVVIGGGETDYWKQDPETDFSNLYQEAYLHSNGETHTGGIKLVPGQNNQTRPEMICSDYNNVSNFILYNPTIELTAFSITAPADTPRRETFGSIAGLNFATKSTAVVYASHSANAISDFVQVDAFGFSGGDDLPNYWILREPVTCPYYEDLLGLNPILIQRQNNDSRSLCIYFPYNYFVGSGGPKYAPTTPIETGGATINTLSEPIFQTEYTHDSGWDAVKRMTFLLSDGSQIEGKADQNLPGNTNSISILTFDLPSIIYEGSDSGHAISYQVIDYDLQGCSGNANLLYVPWQKAAYFYWFATRPADEKSTKGKLDVMATMLDWDRKIVSPVFRLAELTRDEGAGVGLFCLQNDAKTEAKLDSVYYTDASGMALSSVTLPSLPTLNTFAPEFAAVGQGNEFNVYARIENTSAFVLQEVKYDVTARLDQTTTEIPLKNVTIDLRNPDESNVVHLDHLQKDHSELIGRSANELIEALKTMNAAAEYTTVGEHAVYRVPDNYDYFNGNLLRTVTTTERNGEVSVKAETLENYFFMPGNKATYKFFIDGSATSKLDGKYYLTMTMSSAKFSFAMDDSAPVYEAVLRGDGSRYDFYRLDDNGNRIIPKNGEEDGTLAWFNGALPQKPIETTYAFDKGGLNTARNDALTVGNMRYLTMEQNDFELDAREYNLHGVEYVDFTLRNNAPEIAPDVTPRLIAKAVYQGTEMPTGWSTTLNYSNIKDGFSRGITVPINRIINGKRFEEIKVYLVTSTSDDPADFMDQNSSNNKVTLSVTAPFRILRQPESVVVNENTDATFSVLVEGSENCRYQWVVRRPDGVERQLEGENSATLVVHNAQFNQSGYYLACYVTAPDGRTIRSNDAKLTVVIAPPTGDSENPYLFAVVAALCLAAIFMLLKKRRSAKD